MTIHFLPDLRLCSRSVSINTFGMHCWRQKRTICDNIFPVAEGFFGPVMLAVGYLWHQRTHSFICKNKWGGKWGLCTLHITDAISLGKFAQIERSLSIRSPSCHSRLVHVEFLCCSFLRGPVKTSVLFKLIQTTSALVFWNMSWLCAIGRYWNWSCYLKMTLFTVQCFCRDELVWFSTQALSRLWILSGQWVVLWVPSWLGEEFRAVWEVGCMSCLFSITGTLLGPWRFGLEPSDGSGPDIRTFTHRMPWQTHGKMHEVDVLLWLGHDGPLAARA